MNISSQMCERDRSKKQMFGAHKNKRSGLTYRVASMLFAFSVALILLSPQHCFAYEIATPFGALYGAEGHRHLGADVIQSAQSPIVSPVSGTVSFCGKVPKADGQRVVALTLKTIDDHLVTLSPLEDVGIMRGQTIKKGQVLGALASSGDPSFDAPHLHLSLRIQKKYVDPRSLIAPALAETVQTEPVLSSSEVKAQVGARVKSRSDVRAQVAQSAVHVATGISPSRARATSQHYQQSQMSTNKVHEAYAPTHVVQIPSAQTDFRAPNALTTLKEESLTRAHPVTAGRSAESMHTSRGSGARVEVYSAKRFASLSQADIAGILFLSGLTLTLAGWGGYTLLDGKFDIARKLEQLAVRGQR